MNINTGKVINYNDHVKQSVNLIIFTPKMTRVLNRKFGSDVWSYLGSPISSVKMELSAEIISSIERNDVRIDVSQAIVSSNSSNITVDILYNANEIESVTLI